MEIKEFSDLISERKLTVLMIVLAVSAITAVLTFVQPLKYEAKSKLLVVASAKGTVDPYALARSNVYLSNVFANIISTDQFYREVVNSGYDINQDYFAGNNYEQRMKIWNRTVKAKAINDTGFISMSVLHPDKYQLEQIARAVNYILKTRNKEYHDVLDGATIRIVDEPMISGWPVKPDIILNLSLGIIFGFILSLSYIYLTSLQGNGRISQPSSAEVKIEEPDNEENGNENGMTTPEKDYHFNNDYREGSDRGGDEEENIPQSGIKPQGNMKNIFG